jgi:hypothetical protein
MKEVNGGRRTADGQSARIARRLLLRTPSPLMGEGWGEGEARARRAEQTPHPRSRATSPARGEVKRSRSARALPQRCGFALGKFLLSTLLLFAASVVAAEEPPASATVAKVAVNADQAPAQKDNVKSKGAKSETDAKTLSGMSILGNQEAPKALVIVPWKSSQLGDALGISKTLDDGRQPVDKDVFMRELAYYEIRSNSK